MSYGIWRKRGKDWSSFELDGCDEWRWRKMPEFRARILEKQARELGLRCPTWEDPNFVVWFIGQHKRGREVRQVETLSDHRLWVGYRGEASLQSALAAHGYRNLQGESIHATTHQA
jgi:hypothetical protein